MWTIPKVKILWLLYFFIAAALLKDGENTAASLEQLIGDLIKHVPTLHPPPPDDTDE